MDSTSVLTPTHPHATPQCLSDSNSPVDQNLDVQDRYFESRAVFASNVAFSPHAPFRVHLPPEFSQAIILFSQVISDRMPQRRKYYSSVKSRHSGAKRTGVVASWKRALQLQEKVPLRVLACFLHARDENRMVAIGCCCLCRDCDWMPYEISCRGMVFSAVHRGE